MNVVFLSTCDSDLLPLILAVEHRVGLSRLIEISYPQPPSDAEAFPKPIWHPRRYLKKSRSLLSNWLNGADRQLMRDAFPEPEMQPLSDKTLPLRHDQVNAPVGVALLRECEPDLLLTAGAPLLRPEVFSIATLGAVNIHFGCAPDYRGLNTTFWPLYYRDFDKVGITIHYLDAKLDHGAILARGFPAMEPGDGPMNLYIKSVRLAARMLPDVVSAFGNGASPVGKRPEGEGRLFRGRDRRRWHTLWYRCRRRCLGERLPELPERRELYL